MTTPVLAVGSYVQPLGPLFSLVPLGPCVSVSVTVAQNDPNGLVVPTSTEKNGNNEHLAPGCGPGVYWPELPCA